MGEEVKMMASDSEASLTGFINHEFLRLLCVWRRVVVSENLEKFWRLKLKIFFNKNE